MKLLARIAINALALLAAGSLVSGIHMDTGFWTVVLIAVVFGVVNAFIKPIVTILAIPAIVLTLGLFTIVVNAAMLGITAALTDGLDIDGFGSAALGAIVISIVSWVLSVFVGDDSGESDRRRQRR